MITQHITFCLEPGKRLVGSIWGLHARYIPNAKNKHKDGLRGFAKQCFGSLFFVPKQHYLNSFLREYLLGQFLSCEMWILLNHPAKIYGQIYKCMRLKLSDYDKNLIVSVDFERHIKFHDRIRYKWVNPRSSRAKLDEHNCPNKEKVIGLFPV